MLRVFFVSIVVILRCFGSCDLFFCNNKEVFIVYYCRFIDFLKGGCVCFFFRENEIVFGFYIGFCRFYELLFFFYVYSIRLVFFYLFSCNCCCSLIKENDII